MKKLSILVLLLLLHTIHLSLFTTACFSQASSWMRTFGGNFDDRGYYAFQTNDGGFLMVGERAVRWTGNPVYLIPNTYVVKVDYYGTFQWHRFIGDSAYGNYGYTGVQDQSGNYYVTYITDRGSIAKLNSSGQILWTKNFPDSLLGFLTINFTFNQRYFILSGLTFIPNLGFFSSSLTKTDTSGNMIWSRSYYDTTFYNVGKVFLTQNAFYIAQSIQPGNYLTARGLIIKTDTSGNVIWKKFLSTVANRLYSLAANSENTFIACGDVNTSSACGVQFYKFNSSGDSILYKNYYSDSVCNSGLSIVKTWQNNFAVVGKSEYGGTYLLIIDSLGNIISNIKHNLPSQNLVRYRSVNNTSDSGFIIAGVFNVTDNNYDDCLLVKTDKYGNTIPLGINDPITTVHDYELDAVAFPNPFNSTLKIKLSIGKSSFVSLELFNVTGEAAGFISRRYFRAGSHTLTFEPEKFHLASGIYFLKIQTEDKFISRKIVYLK